jgi:regulator of sigma E protease
MTHLSNILDYVYLAIGFGLVVFIHELGHFLAAKYCDVKVEQFAVGFGPAVLSWRKGMGLRYGSSGEQLEKLKDSPAELARVGETEYRLNWIPLGGYVKMLGQDDLRPGGVADDPRAYNNKTIRARMLIVSAGVIMNVILAAVGFMIVFLVGYPVPPATVGGVVSLSPAVQTVNAGGVREPLVAGDQILSIDGKKTIGDFTKIQLGVALSEEGQTIPIEVRRLDGTQETLYAKPGRPGDDPRGLLAIGITLPSELAGLDAKTIDDWDPAEMRQTLMPDTLAVAPGDVITEINGRPVRLSEFWKLDQALTASNGNPVDITIKSPDGTISHRSILPHFQPAFGKQQLDFLGMVPRAMVNMIQDDSPALGKLKPGDVILAVEGGGDRMSNPSPEQLRTVLSDAGAKQLPVDLTVLSLGETQPHQITGIVPTVRIGNGRIGLGIGIGYYDERHLVVAQVLPDTSAFGKIPAWATLTAINSQPISTWFDVRQIVAAAKPGDVLEISYQPYSAEGAAAPAVAGVAEVKLSADDIANAQMVAFTSDLQLRPAAGTMKTSNPLIALEWGVGETRDAILELYVTLERMFTGEVSVTNVMGPVGMFHAGAQLAGRGFSWLLWFLANISANLAVVNFLPIPIVDGGLFTLLILEKIQGKPLSAEMQKVVQTVGLVLILGVFLLVTYQDIARMTGLAN